MNSLFDEPSPSNGEMLRDNALSLLRAARAELIRQCRGVAIDVARQQGEVCADDVRDRVVIPENISPKLVGVVFKDLAREGILRHAGFRKSRRPKAHARPVSVWQLAGGGA